MSKLQRLRDNIAAIECALKGGNDHEVLAKYTGFGGLAFILNSGDPSDWNKSDMVYYEDTERLHTLLREHSKDDKQYNAWMQSLKSSTLTAYYTPKEVIRAMERAFAGIDFNYMLDPAAGNGVFIRMGGSARKTVAYEKDLLTGLLLKRGIYGHWDNVEVRVKGFETFPNDELATYDLVTTNVPFGNISVFDTDYDARRNTAYREACKMIHRYYVLKGLDCLRDGGIEAYIITSNYLNRDGDQLAEALKKSRLIGAYRLANNLFKDAGTEVGTDLLVLQKDSHKQGISADESMLLTQYEDGGCPTNLYFECYGDHVIASHKKVDTDAYGHPGYVYTHDGGVQGISEDLGKVLAADMAANCDVSLFEKGSQQKAEEEHRKQEQKKHSAMELAILHIHKTYKALYEYEATKLEENAELRRELNKQYDEFYALYGPLNYTANKYHVKQLKVNDLLGLEIRSEKTGMWEKADIMLKPIAFSTDDLHEAQTAQEALAQSLNDYGKPDMRYMAAMTGKTDLVESFKSTLDEVREADLLVHVVDISHPDFEDQIRVVEETLKELGCADKPAMLVFNKIDAYTWVEKEEDDLTPATKENMTLDDLEKTWMARTGENQHYLECLFISAKQKDNIDALRDILYKRVRELHVQKYPYNDFLYQDYE